MAIQVDTSATTRRLLLAIAVAIVLVLVALPSTAESRASGYPLTIEVRTTSRGDQAMPFNFAIQPRHVVRVIIRNYTRDLHTFTIPAIGLNAVVLPGSPRAPRTRIVSFVAPRYGIYDWFCLTCRHAVHKHGHMSGKFYAWISPALETG